MSTSNGVRSWFSVSRAVWLATVAAVAAIVVTAALWYPPLIQPSYRPQADGPFMQSTADMEARVDINRASLAELTVLPGIGEKKAQAIIAYREANGPFTELDELLNVQGLGPKIVEELAELVTFD